MSGICVCGKTEGLSGPFVKEPSTFDRVTIVVDFTLSRGGYCHRGGDEWWDRRGIRDN